MHAPAGIRTLWRPGWRVGSHCAAAAPPRRPWGGQDARGDAARCWAPLHLRRSVWCGHARVRGVAMRECRRCMVVVGTVRCVVYCAAPSSLYATITMIGCGLATTFSGGVIVIPAVLASPLLHVGLLPRPRRAGRVRHAMHAVCTERAPLCRGQPAQHVEGHGLVGGCALCGGAAQACKVTQSQEAHWTARHLCSGVLVEPSVGGWCVSVSRVRCVRVAARSTSLTWSSGMDAVDPTQCVA